MKEAAIYFDRDLVENLRSAISTFHLLSWVYRSNWRVLHIDGFEGGRRIPLHMGESRQFFTYGGENDETL